MTLDHIISKEVFELGLPMNLVKSASHLGRRLARRGLTHQLIKTIDRPHEEPKDVLAPSLIYAACRQDGVPMTTSILARYISGGQSGSAGPKNAILLNYGLIKNRLLGFDGKILTPQDYVPLICRFAVNAVNEDTYRQKIKLSCIDDLQAKAIQILNSFKITSKPQQITRFLSYAAGAVYLAAIELGIPLTQRGIADVADLTEVTVRQRYIWMALKLGVEPAGRSHQALTISNRPSQRPKTTDEEFKRLFSRMFPGSEHRLNEN